MHIQATNDSSTYKGREANYLIQLIECDIPIPVPLVEIAACSTP